MPEGIGYKQSGAAKPNIAGLKPISEVSHAEILRRRAQPGADQALLAPFEHRAFAREWMQESPLAAGLSLPFAIPGYTIAKALGLQPARSPASLDELFAGFHGYGEGVQALMQRAARRNPLAAAMLNGNGDRKR